MGASDAGGYNRLCVCAWSKPAIKREKRTALLNSFQQVTVVAGILVVVPIYGRPNLVDP